MDRSILSKPVVYEPAALCAEKRRQSIKDGGTPPNKKRPAIQNRHSVRLRKQFSHAPAKPDRPRSLHEARVFPGSAQRETATRPKSTSPARSFGRSLRSQFSNVRNFYRRAQRPRWGLGPPSTLCGSVPKYERNSPRADIAAQFMRCTAGGVHEPSVIAVFGQ
jgi:hypothetical protein